MARDMRGDRNRLSWAYRNKKRQGKVGKNNNSNNNNRANEKSDGANARILIKNLSFQVTSNDLKELYGKFGQIDEINIPKRPDGKPVGCAFIQFRKMPDASKAIFKTNKAQFLERPITVAWAIPKSKYVEKLKKEEEFQDNNNSEVPVKKDDDEENKIVDNSENAEEKIIDEKSKKSKHKLTPEERKALKLKKRLKRSRIIVRNLSFKATEEDLKNHFKEFGDIGEIEILKKDGKKTGCAFVQFNQVQSAAKAIHYSNMKTVIDRPIVVDWAVPKKKFLEHIEIKKEPVDPDEVQIKEEKVDDDDGDEKPNLEDITVVEDEVKDIVNGDKDVDTDSDNESSSDEDDDEKSDDDDEDQDDEDDEDAESSEDELVTEADIKGRKSTKTKLKEEEEKKGEKNEESLEKKPRVISHDVREGKTIFLKNVPFSAYNEDIKKCMEKFGPVFYALVCMDPLTEHSKGTAFVKFRNVEDAEKCIAARQDELILKDQILEPHRALDKNDITNNKTERGNKIKDSRNLYLVKEGVIVAGTPSAMGVSAVDMKKRLQLEQWKSQMLKNLNMFVSRVRLVVHNLPESVDNSMLRSIFKKYSGPKAVVTEARVMRDMKTIDAKGVGKSKGFGFVAFTTHDDALKALRNINNNPNIFSKAMRPIVAFSIENRVIVNVKQRRIEKSRENNPLWKGYKERNNNKRENDEKGSSINDPPKKRFKSEKHNGVDKNEAAEFSGMKSIPGRPGKLRSRHKLKTQALVHDKMRKQEKRVMKNKREMIERKKSLAAVRKEVKPKQRTKKINANDANFNKLVDEYKNKLSSIPRAKSKWYETG